MPDGGSGGGFRRGRRTIWGAVLAGSYTRSFWALVRSSGGWRLVEAVSVRELAMAIANPDGWPWP